MGEMWREKENYVERNEESRRQSERTPGTFGYIAPTFIESCEAKTRTYLGSYCEGRRAVIF